MQLAHRYPGEVGVHIGFNEADARRMAALKRKAVTERY